MQESEENVSSGLRPYLAGRRVAIVVNETAGTAVADTAASCEEPIAAAFEDLGVHPEVSAVEPSRLASVLQEAARSEAEVVVVGGGDGSINTAAGFLQGTSKVLGVLPLGTLNHFAQSIGMPITPLESAIRALSFGMPRAVDLGEVNGRVFVNNASIGMYPVAVRLRERYQQKLGLRKYVAMSYALFTLLRDLPVFKLLIEEERLKEVIKTPFLFLGNNRYQPRFLSYAERESLTDGCLSVFFANDIQVLAMLRIAVKILLGLSTKDPELGRLEAVELKVRSRARRLEVALDGEVKRLSTPLRFRVLPGALNVLFPCGPS